MRFPPRKILATILKVNERRSSANGPVKRKHMTMHKTLNPRHDVERLYVSKWEEKLMYRHFKRQAS